MRGYKLQPNESVLLREQVTLESKRLRETGELLLTNLNLVYMPTRILGRPKPSLVYQMDQLKVYNNEAQALVRGKKQRSPATLEVFFVNGHAIFGFHRKDDADAFANKMHEVRVGTPRVLPSSNNRFAGADTPAGVLKGAVGALAGILLGTDAATTEQPAAATPALQAAPAPRKSTSRRCSYCQAPISGLEGDEISCDYCGSTQHL